jgi:alkanesulfonate monooxygenase SsuD/methylene tetrahydromethanopterin reductase-like flavin-dependent oxidoreductase (luciferase family)
MEFGTPIVYGEAHARWDEDMALFERILELCKAADRAGFTRIWFQEHHMIALGQSPSALISCVQAAQHVKARVGAAVVVLPYHNAIQIAGEIAQADNATGGRLDLGVGRGAYGYEFEKFGIPFAESRDRFIETLDAVRELLSNEATESSFHGQFVNFDDVYVWPRPLQKPHPPIWIAAQTLPAVQDAARRGYNVLHQTFIWDDEHVKSVVEAFHRGKEEGGHEHIQLAATRYAYLAENEADAEARLDDLLDNWRVHQQLHDFSHTSNPRGIIQPVPQENEPDRDELRERVMIGTEDHVVSKIELYRDMGLDILNFGINFGSPFEVIRGSLDRLAPVLARYESKVLA